MLPPTTERVPRNTSPRVNAQIRSQTAANLDRYSALGPAAIDRRLAALDREWDIERLLEANASALVVIGCGLGALVNRKFFAMPAVIGAFLFQHALQGWCPPVPLLRRLGVRTQTEIEEERYALKAIRGDFNHGRDEVTNLSPVSQALADIGR